MKFSRRVLSLIAIAALTSTAYANEPLTVTVGKVKDLSLRMYGFVETDVIADTTGGFTEEQGNNLVPMHTSVSANQGDLLLTNARNANSLQNFTGNHHRTEMSVRNSRLGFDFTLPKTDAGLASEAVFELDFLGNNAANTQPGAAPGAQSERDFFNNPAVRVRHAYMNLTYNDSWNAKVGQYWSLLGWQPYYFPGESVVMPGVGQLYRRFAQARATHTCKLPADWTLEEAFDAAKPAEMNSGNPELHAGLRLASSKYKAASIGGAGTSMVGLSAAVSGALIPIQTGGLGNPMGSAVAFDVALPIIASKDGKDRSNTLVVMGEIMSGSGVGGLEYSGLTLGVPGVAAGLATGSAIDSGIAGINLDNNVELVSVLAWRTHLQYSLPGGKWAVSGGYAQVEGKNLDHFAAPGTITTQGGNLIKTWAGIAPKLQYGYVSVFYDAASWLRFAAEASQTRDTYNDPNNRFATNNRYQFNAFFLF